MEPMSKSITRKASRLATLVALVLGGASIAACSSAGEPKDDSSSENALTCAPGTACGSPQPACDPATACCWQGGQMMGATACGTVLYNNGCRASNGGSKAFAVETDGTGHWWFEVYCPSGAESAVVNSVCAAAGVHWNFPGDQCTVNAPPSGKVDVIYDPNCPSGCKAAIN
jgi:hypothetical protein